MPHTTIILTEKEQNLLKDASIWQAKRSLMYKLTEMLDEVKSNSFQISESAFTSHIDSRGWQSKISRGENYEGYPYLILDAPNYFSKDACFAVRNMIWYGNYISSFLLINGSALQKVLPHLTSEKLSKYEDELHICIHETPWDHRFTADNMIPLKLHHKNLSELPFIKLGLKSSIKETKEMYAFFIQAYGIYTELIS